MKSMSKPDLDWPYLDGEWGSEGPGHVRMKNTAVYFLMSLGFDPSNIEEEVELADVYAERPDGSAVIVECETSHINRWTPGDPHENGHKVFVLTPRGLYEVVGQNPAELVAIKGFQATLSPGRTRIGRWFADGREPSLTPYVDPGHRPLSGTEHSPYEFKAPAGYNRWRADGKEKRDSMYGTDELYRMWKDAGGTEADLV